MRLFTVLALSIAAVTMTFAQSSSKQIVPRRQPDAAVQRRGQGRRA